MLKAWKWLLWWTILFILAPAVVACGAAGEVPELEDGKIRAGSDITWVPFEFFEGGSTTPTGFDVELFEAVAEKLGVEVEWVNIEFTEIILGLQAEQFDVIVSGMTVTETRDEVIDFVPYYFAGITLLVTKGNPKNIHHLDDLSGLSVSTKIGTTWQDLLEAENRELRSAGTPLIDIQLYATDSSAVDQLRQGLVDANMTDNPVADYTASLEPDTFESLSNQILLESAPFGWGVREKSPNLKDALSEAFKELIADGTYDSVIRKWGLERGTIVGKGIYD